MFSFDSSTSLPFNRSQIDHLKQQEKSSVDEPYSPKTGIRTAALLGGMLFLVVVSILWKARSRIWCSYFHRSTANPFLSHAKFDLDYWLKQVDILEARDAERYREGLSPNLELPREQPRDNQAATASWIGESWRHWYLTHYQRQYLSNQVITSNTSEIHPPSARRFHWFRRFFRRLFLPTETRSTYFLQHSSSILADICSNFDEPTLLPMTFPRRVASWPRLQSMQQLAASPRSALQIQIAREQLFEYSKDKTTSSFR